MDAHPPLLHLDAHVGRRGRRGDQEADPQAAPAGLDSEQGAAAAHQQLQPRLARRESPRSPGGQLRPG